MLRYDTHARKANVAEHPIDQLCAEHFAGDRQMRNTPMKAPGSQYKSATKHIIQRQQVIRSFLSKSNTNEPSSRKAAVLDTQPAFLSITSISSSQPLISESNEPSATIGSNNNRQQKIERPAPLLARRQRYHSENSSLHPQASDWSNLTGPQITLTIPSNLNLRQRPPRVVLSDRSAYRNHGRVSSPRIKSPRYAKPAIDTRSSLAPPKANSLLSPTWTPTVTDQEAMHVRTLTDILRTKPQLTAAMRYHHPQTTHPEDTDADLKPSDFQDLHISSRAATNSPQELHANTDFADKDWEDFQSNSPSGSTSADDHSSTSTCCSSFTSTDPSPAAKKSPAKSQGSTTKRKAWRRRWTYNAPLPPVAEHLDEETDLARILEKISALRTKEFTDEDSLTFHLLNQEDTAFEKQLHKRRKQPGKQTY